MSRRVVIAIFIAGGLLAVAVAATSLIIIRGAGSATISVNGGNAQSVNTTVDLPFNDLILNGGGTELVTGSVNFALPAYQPLVDYVLADNTGLLTIRQPELVNQNDAQGIAPSELHFSDSMPLALTLRRQQDATQFDLSSLSLSQVEAALGDGEDNIILNDIHPTLTDLTLDTNAGDDRLAANCDCPSLLNADISTASGKDSITFSGTYPLLGMLAIDGGTGDDALMISGDFPAIVSSIIQLGEGDDALVLDGNYRAGTNLVINIGTGNDRVTLGPNWANDATITLISEGDSTSLELPSSIGVIVEIASRSNTVSAEGFSERDGAYVNEAYGVSPVTLHVNVNTTPNEMITLSLAG